MDDVLSISGLSLGVKNKRIIVEGINLSQQHQEFVAIIGPNGCGKSSFIRTLMGELDVLSGVIDFLQQPLASFNRKLRSRYIALMGAEEHG